ncbi:hypothetical protein P9X10_01115 [Bacillus cereus]|nr:hypothetical protein [Bacillus cereus]
MFRQQELEVNFKGNNYLVGALLYNPQSNILFHSVVPMKDLGNDITCFLLGSYATGKDTLLLYMNVVDHKTKTSKQYFFSSADWYLENKPNNMNESFVLEPTDLDLEDFVGLAKSIIEDKKRNF